MFLSLCVYRQSHYLPVQRCCYATRPSRLSNVNYNAAPGEVPAIIPGKAGEVAMNFFKNVWKHSGDVGVKTFESELNLLTWSVKKDSAWELTRSPLISLEKKNQIVTDRIKKLGCSDFFVSQILTLVKSENLFRLNQIRFDFEEIMRAFRREIDVTLITKSTLSAEDLEFYKRSIRSNYLSPQDNIIFKHQVDPSITKGYKIELSGQLLDYTWNRDQENQERKFKAKTARALSVAQQTYPEPDFEAASKILDPEGRFNTPLFKVPKPAKIKLPEFLGGHEISKVN